MTAGGGARAGRGAGGHTDHIGTMQAALLLEGIETRQRHALRALAKDSGLAYENVKATAALRLWRGSKQRESCPRCPPERMEDGHPLDEWLVHVVRATFGLDATAALAAKPLAQPCLPVGTWRSSTWPLDGDGAAAQRDFVLVLWDLDQGSWDEWRMAARLDAVEGFARARAAHALPVHAGCVNPRAASRQFWRGLLEQHARGSASSPWWRRASKLEVVAPVGGLVDQAADMQLQRCAEEQLQGAHALAAIVLVSHDDGLTRAVATRARLSAVPFLAVRWRTATGAVGGKRERNDGAPAEVAAATAAERLLGAMPEVAAVGFLSEDGSRLVASLES